MNKRPLPVPAKRYAGSIVVLVLAILLLFVILPRTSNFSASFLALANANHLYVLPALALTIVTFAFAGGVYQALALKLKGVTYKHTVMVQIAGAFTNRLLPAGLGALTLNVQYLRKHGHTNAQAAAVSGLNNLFGFAGHFVLLVAAMLAGHREIAGDLAVSIDMRVALFAILVVVVAVTIASFNQHFRSFTAGAWRYIGLYRNYPEKLVGALACSVALTLCYVCTFYFSVLALGADLSILQIFVVFTVGMIAGTVSPTPGGLVGAEAGMVAGLAAYGIDTSSALAAVLLYRFMTYWLPLLPGFAMLLYIRPRYL